MPENRIFLKKPLPYQELIEKLSARGLIVDDPGAAIIHLKNISYYRLIGYGLPFEERNDRGERRHRYQPDTTFNQLINAYVVDRKIRMLIMSAIERIEVATRSIVNHEMAAHYDDAHWYLRAELFKESSSFTHRDLISEVKRHTAKTAEADSDKAQKREIFIHHYYNHYDEPEYPPCWMVAEILSLGSWSKIFEHIKTSQDRKRISRQLDLAPGTLQSWLHTLTYLRNMCAHHSRLFGRNFVIRPSSNGQPLKSENQLHNYISTTFWLLRKVSPTTGWLDRISDELDKLDSSHLAHYGFEANWLDDEFWLE